MKISKSIYILLILTISCKDKNSDKSEVENSNNNNNMIENILKKQIIKGANHYIDEAGVEMPKNEFDILEFDAIVNLCSEKLYSSGYKTISQEEFGNKINRVFGRTITFSSEKKYLYINNFNKCDQEFNQFPFNGVDYNGTYIIKKEKFITNFYFLPELINYKNEYPEIFNIEGSTPVKYIDNDNNSYSIELWKDIPDLDQQRDNNIQTLVNRNKFLFNDSKASFAWLKFNDAYFLESLVKTFGYVEDKDLSKFVLDRSLEDNDEFGKVLWNKDCKDNLQFHVEILNIIKELPKEKQAKYYDKILDYLDYLLIDKLHEKAGEVDLTFSQKIEMLGKLAYYATKSSNNNVDFYYRFFKYLNDEKYQKEFEKQAYYKIKDFKEVYEETKNGGVWLPGMPEPE